MPYTLVQLIDTGRASARPGVTEKIFFGSDAEAGTNLVRLGDDRAILWTPTVTLSDPSVTVLADDGLDTLTPTRRTALANLAGDRVFGSTDRVKDIIYRLLRFPPVRWNALRATVDGRYELWLGPGAVGRNLLVSELTDPSGPHSQDIQDTFNRADSALSGSTSSDAQFTWAIGQGISAQINIVSNQLRLTRSGSDNYAVGVPSLAMDTADHYAQADLINWTYVASLVDAEVDVRLTNGTGTGDSGYSWATQQDGASSFLRRFYDFVTNGTLASDTTSSTSGTLYLSMSGSTYTCKLNGATLFTGTDTKYPGTGSQKKVGISGAAFGNNGNIVNMDNFRGADLVAPASGMLGMVTIS